MEFDESWLDLLLKKFSFQESVIKIKTINVEETFVKGENYLSLIKRVKADVVLGSGRKKKMALVVKQQFKAPLLKEMSVNNGYFAREIGMYRDILPKMEELMDEVCDSDEPLWPKCLDVNLFDTLIFEDLNAQGYSMALRKVQMDFTKASFVLRCLGKFHAMGAVLNERLEVPADLYWYHPWVKMIEQYRSQFKGNLYILADMLENWGEDWLEAKPTLLELIPAYWMKFENYLLQPCKGLKVLAHADCWTNNMLFRNDAQTKAPISMKFLDFQLSFLTSPCFDLHWFFVSSVNLETRRTQLNELLETYTDSLRTNLEKFGFEGERPSLEKITEEFEKLKFFSFIFSSFLAPPVLNDEKDALDIDDMIEKNARAQAEGENFVYGVFTNLSEAATNLLKYETREVIKNGIYW